MKKLKRINVMIREDQYEKLQQKEISVSGLIRDLIDDRFSETKIILSVSEECGQMYDKIISNFGGSDMQLEKFFMAALDKFLESKTKEISKFRKKLCKK